MPGSSDARVGADAFQSDVPIIHGVVTSSVAGREPEEADSPNGSGWPVAVR